MFRCPTCHGELASGPTTLQENMDHGPPRWRTVFSCAPCGRDFTRYVRQSPSVGGKPSIKYVDWTPAKPEES